jgi:hypothetical protein
MCVMKVKTQKQFENGFLKRYPKVQCKYRVKLWQETACSRLR